MIRPLSAVLALALPGALLGSPTRAVAQARVSVEWNGVLSGGPYVYAEFGTAGAYVVGSFGQPVLRRGVVRSRRPVRVRRGVLIPPGHLPPPGECRIWYPNRPPGHQPPPFRCVDRYRAPYGGGYGHLDRRYDDRWDRDRWDDDRWDRDRWDDDRWDDDRWDRDRWDDDRWDRDFDEFGPVGGPGRYLEDPRGKVRRDVDRRGNPGGRRGPPPGRATRATEGRWAAIERAALELRRELQREGRSRGNRR